MTLATRKTYSWAVVSFFVILVIDLVAHLVIHGSHGFGDFAITAGIGTFLACIGKSPVYLVHERVWDRVSAPTPEPEPVHEPISHGPVILRLITR